VLRVYLQKELRSLFRDRNILLYGVLLPLFLYPALLFFVTQIQLYSEGLKGQTRPVVAVVQAPSLLDWLQDHGKEDCRFRTLRGSSELALESGDVDVVLSTVDKGRSVRIEYYSTRGASLLGVERLRSRLLSYQEHVEREEGRRVALDEAVLNGPELLELDVADPGTTSRFLISLILPLILIVMCSFGATYPALELTAGEREKRTAETTLLLPVPTQTIALGKCLAVTLIAFLALLINLIAMLISAGPMLAAVQGKALSLPSIAWDTAPWILFFGLLVSLVFANLFLLVGSYAKNHREAQAYVTPLQVLILLPALLSLVPGADLTQTTAWIPIYNAALLFRAAFQGHIDSLSLMIGVGSMGLLSLASFRMTVHRLSRRGTALGIRDRGSRIEGLA